MRPLLRDPSAQQQFEHEGFVVARLLSKEQVASLLGLYDQWIGPETVSGLYESSRQNSYRVNRLINAAIRDQVAVAARTLFLPSKLYGGTFMVKSPEDSEVLPLHQDWSMVEEQDYLTLFVWCPLMDVSVENGGLFVLPGSHRYFRSLRSGSYPSDRFILPAQLHRHAVDISLRAGEAILYSDALFHGSHANNGSGNRIVVTARVMETEAALVYFQRANDREVDVYQADEEFYLTHIDRLAKGLMPANARKLYRRSYEHVPVTDASLQAKIREHFEVRGEGSPMKQLFKDAALQRDFERDGFVVIDLLDHEQIDELTAFYAGLANAVPPAGGFQVSLDNESPEFVRTVSLKLTDTVRSSVARHFQNHRIFTASFVTKAKDPLGVVPPHQDWTFVDESRFWSATIWCPLVDVDVDNGGLGLIKGSHRLYDHVRPSPSPQYSPPFKDQLLHIFPYLTLMALKAGQAVVFNNQTLHASPPNTARQTRVAFGIGITHEDAQLRHYYLLPRRESPLVEGYEVQPQFFFRYNNARLSALHDKGEKPRDLNSIGIFSVQPRRYETSQLVEAMRAAGNRENTSLAHRLIALGGQTVDACEKGGAAGERREATAKRAEASRPLWKVYTPANIFREVRYRLSRG
jgi:ectoine hydroxylase-related dioxygenase (phytanoyl-CoA dioxygenase family)